MAQKNFKVNNGLTTPVTTFLYDDGNTANTRTVNVSTSTASANYSLQLPPTSGALVQAVLGAVTLDSGGILDIAITSGGSGYTAAPPVIISGDGQFGVAHAVLTNGVITSIVIDNSGSGYTTATASVGNSGARYLAIDNNSGNLLWNQISTIDLQAVNSAVLFSNNAVISGDLSFTYNPQTFTGAIGCTFPGGQNAAFGYSNITHYIDSNRYTKIAGDTGLTFGGAEDYVGTNAHSITIQVPPPLSGTWSSYTLTLPTALPASNGYSLVGNTDGVLKWAAPTSLVNGNSNVAVAANANVTVSSNGQANIVVVSSDATNGLVTVTGNVAANNISTTGATGNITGANIISANTFKTTSNGAVVVLANNGTSTQQVTLKASTAAGFTANYTLTLPVDDGTSGQVLITDGSGVLSWGAAATIANGNSNVNIPAANGNVNISAVGNANILVVTGTGANITGTANISGNTSVGNLIVSGNVQSNLLPNANITYDLGSSTQRWRDIWLANSTIYLGAQNISANSTTITFSGNVTANSISGNITGNVTSGNLVNGNSTVIITANANITLTAKSNATMVISDTGANITGTANVSGNLYSANANLGNAVTANYFIGSGANLTSIAGANVTGKVAYANVADYTNTTATSTNATYYPLFVDNSGGGNRAPYVGTGLTFNPGTYGLTTGVLTLSSGQASFAYTSFLAKAANASRTITTQNGSGTDASGADNGRIGLYANGSGWDSFTQFIQGDAAQTGRQVLWAGNTAVANIANTGIAITGNLSASGTIQVSGKQAVNGPAFSAYANNTLQTITSGSQQKVLFQSEEFDTNNNFASSRFTPTVEGYYQLNAEVRLDGASGTGEMMIVIWKNGAEYKRGTNQSGTQIASNFWAMTVSSLVYANGSTDYFEIYVQQGSGGSVTVTAVNSVNITWFNGCMVRGA